MDSPNSKPKLEGVLKGIAAGRTCEQILAADHTLSYHDLFHAMAEAPTRYWRRAAATGLSRHALRRSAPVRKTARQRAD